MTACVYVLVKQGRPIYVGQSMSLQNRLKEHRWRRFDSCWYQEVPLEDRIRLESEVIRRLSPPMNKAHNDSLVRPPVKEIVFPVRMEDRHMTEIAKIAGKEKRTRSAVIRLAIGEYLKRRAK